MPLIDLTGRRFGRLTVLRRSGTYHYKRGGSDHTCPLWLCRCDCGAEAEILGNNLRAGRSRSCGCLRSETSRMPRVRLEAAP